MITIFLSKLRSYLNIQAQEEEVYENVQEKKGFFSISLFYLWLSVCWIQMFYLILKKEVWMVRLLNQMNKTCAFLSVLKDNLSNSGKGLCIYYWLCSSLGFYTTTTKKCKRIVSFKCRQESQLLVGLHSILLTVREESPTWMMSAWYCLGSTHHTLHNCCQVWKSRSQHLKTQVHFN